LADICQLKIQSQAPEVFLLHTAYLANIC
jgi:hypothetical protein